MIQILRESTCNQDTISVFRPHSQVSLANSSHHRTYKRPAVPLPFSAPRQLTLLHMPRDTFLGAVPAHRLIQSPSLNSLVRRWETSSLVGDLATSDHEDFKKESATEASKGQDEATSLVFPRLDRERRFLEACTRVPQQDRAYYQVRSRLPRPTEP